MQKFKRGFAPILILLLLGSIAVAGFVLYKQRVQSTVSQSSTTPQSSLTQDNISDWKTYINEDLGFQIKYPPFLKVVEDKNEGKIFRIFIQNYDELNNEPPEGTIEDFQLVIQPDQEATIETLEAFRGKDEQRGYTTTNYLINGEPAYKYTSPAKGGKAITVMTVHKGKVYPLFTLSTKSKYLPYFDQILSTFKFLN